LTVIIDGCDGRHVYDPVTLDQLRALVAVVEEGSFSAAARRLKRVQSAISTSMANLEEQLGVPIWDRTTKVARLTDQGKAVVGSARRVLAEVDGLRRLAASMVMGLEASVSLCVDALFPLPALLDLCRDFAKAFPAVELRVQTEVLSAVSDSVLRGTTTLGVVGPHGLVAGLEREPLATIELVAVVSPDHPLAKVQTTEEGRVTARDLADATQIVLSERSDDGVPDQGVLSARTWRVGDLHTKHMMLRRGLGWGNLPEHLVREDVLAGRLVVLRPASWAERENLLPLSAVYRSDTVFGPAHRWILARLKTLCARDSSAAPSRSPSRSPSREQPEPVPVPVPVRAPVPVPAPAAPGAPAPAPAPAKRANHRSRR
jgi:DNA-binding transcriptional LysR family regulator